MIYIDRTKIEIPTFFSSPERVKAFRDAEAYFMTPNPDQQQQHRFKFDERLIRQDSIMDALEALFHSKCAYCESPIRAFNGEVEWYRPKANAMGLDGKVSFPHYWWLAYDWDNIYLICNKCNNSKSSRFPVEGFVDSPPGSWRLLYNSPMLETPLLLDPCNLDDFQEPHIIFDKNGLAVGLSEKGQVSIDVYGLNRTDLVESRKEIWEATIKPLKSYYTGNWPLFVETVIKGLHPGNSYAAVRKYALQSFFKDNDNEIFTIDGDFARRLRRGKDLITCTGNYQESERLRSELPSPIRATFEEKQPISKPEARIKEESVEQEINKGEYNRTKSILRIKIKDFKALKDFEVNVPDGRDGEASWLMLIGENGRGKSTLLQAVALALMGEHHYKKLKLHEKLDAKDFINKESKDGKGRVEVMVEGLPEPVVLEFSKDSSEFNWNTDAKMTVIGYGATRLLNKYPDEPHQIPVNAANLFDQYAKLNNGEEWITERDENTYPSLNEIFRTLNTLIMSKGDKGEELSIGPSEKGDKSIKYVTKDLPFPLDIDDLGLGYQSILAMAMDMMEVIGTVSDSYEMAPGIVLIDEIETHLHPKWKMEIVRLLRNTFRRMQFIVTTHDPLCLRGTKEGEVVLMDRDNDQDISGVQNLPSQQVLRVYQILTSLFGLDTAHDKDQRQKLARLYELLALSERTEAEDEELKSLKILEVLVADPSKQAIIASVLNQEDDDIDGNVKSSLNNLFRKI